jgi:hypothetical protein
MSRITYFAVLPFSREGHGNFLAEAAIEMRSGEQPREPRLFIQNADACRFIGVGEFFI